MKRTTVLLFNEHVNSYKLKCEHYTKVRALYLRIVYADAFLHKVDQKNNY